MARKAKNRYRLTVGGLKVELSLLKEYTDTASDLDIAKTILRHMRFYSVYESVYDGAPFDLKMIRASKAQCNMPYQQKKKHSL